MFHRGKTIIFVIALGCSPVMAESEVTSSSTSLLVESEADVFNTTIQNDSLRPRYADRTNIEVDGVEVFQFSYPEVELSGSQYPPFSEGQTIPLYTGERNAIGFCALNGMDPLRRTLKPSEDPELTSSVVFQHYSRSEYGFAMYLNPDARLSDIRNLGRYYQDPLPFLKTVSCVAKPEPSSEN